MAHFLHKDIKQIEMMDFEEFNNWLIYMKLNPPIEERTDIYMSYLINTIICVNGGKQQDIPLINWKADYEEIDEEEMYNKCLRNAIKNRMIKEC